MLLKKVSALITLCITFFLITGCSPEEDSTTLDITSVSLTPSSATVINVTFPGTESFLPELLGTNSVVAHRENGVSEILDCWGHHYNAEINEHVLHCTLPSTGANVYFGLSSSNTAVIAFSYTWAGSYYMSYWNPVAPGSTQITGSMLFNGVTSYFYNSAPVEFTIDVTLNSI